MLGGCGVLCVRLESLDVPEGRVEGLPVDSGRDPFADEVDEDQVLRFASRLRLPEDEQPGLSQAGFFVQPRQAPAIEGVAVGPERLLEGVDLEIEAEADGRCLRIGHAEDERLDRDVFHLCDGREGIRGWRIMTLAFVATLPLPLPLPFPFGLSLALAVSRWLHGLHRLWQPERLEDGVVEAGRFRGVVGVGRVVARCVALLRNFWRGRGWCARGGEAEGEERHRRQHGEEPAEKPVAPCVAVRTHAGNIPSPRGVGKHGADWKGARKNGPVTGSALHARAALRPAEGQAAR